jgi:hypothetical protein
MGKLLNSGITWSDVANLMSGLEGIHECTVELTVLLDGSPGNGLLAITASAWIPTVEKHHTRMLAELKRSWPNGTHPTFDNCVFNLLYDLDREIGRNYVQEKIPD